VIWIPPATLKISSSQWKFLMLDSTNHDRITPSSIYQNSFSCSNESGEFRLCPKMGWDET
jgi:hypothetical protein